MTDQPKLSTADSLRLLADWYEAHPEIGFTPEIVVSASEAAEGAESEVVRKVAQALGTFEKQVSDSLFKIIGTFGGVKIKFLFWRKEVCTPRVVKTEKVMVRKPDPAYPEPPMVEVEETRDVLEWDCPSLLAPEEEKAA